MLKLILANPTTSKELIRYPVLSETGVISHPAEAGKWKEDIEFHHAGSVWSGQLYHYEADDKKYIGKVSKLYKDKQGLEFIGDVQLYEEVPTLDYDGKRCLVDKRSAATVPLKQLDLCHRKEFLVYHEDMEEYSEHEYRIFYKASSFMSKGKNIVTMPVNLFVDDTATHKSRRWLPLHCVQMQAAGLPLHMRQKLLSTNFLAASEKTDIDSVMRPILDDIKQCKRDGVPGFDALTGKACIIATEVDVVVADFQMLAHLCNHMGAAANKYCPRCHGETFGRKFFTHYESKQGKDFKAYLQVAPINLATIQTTRHIVEMACTLAKLQQEICASEIDSSGIQRIQDLAQTYVQQAGDNEPQLLNKVKTHLLMHLESDIKRHGPPTGYTEDAFEKMHGSIRQHIFCTNQKARSHDTATSFARMSVANHLLTGGYYPDGCDQWKQCSDNVQLYGAAGEVQRFLGTYVKDEPTIIEAIKLKRKQNNKVDFTPITDDVRVQCYPFIPLDSEGQMVEASALKTPDGTIINMKDGVRYRNRENEISYGLLDKASLLQLQRKKVFIARMKTMNPTTQTVAGCHIYRATTNHLTVPVASLIGPAAFVHNCTKCNFVHSSPDQYAIKHMSEEYILNVYQSK